MGAGGEECGLGFSQDVTASTVCETLGQRGEGLRGTRLLPLHLYNCGRLWMWVLECSTPLLRVDTDSRVREPGRDFMQ